jgi:PHD/YefM family antitoxin component YafN of YafNO toxin-antitoxin module
MNEMNITSAQYIVPIDETENTMIRATIDGVELYVPLNSPGNRHYDEIMKQVEAGDLTIADAD